MANLICFKKCFKKIQLAGDKSLYKLLPQNKSDPLFCRLPCHYAHSAVK